MGSSGAPSTAGHVLEFGAGDVARAAGRASPVGCRSHRPGPSVRRPAPVAPCSSPIRRRCRPRPGPAESERANRLGRRLLVFALGPLEPVGPAHAHHRRDDPAADRMTILASHRHDQQAAARHRADATGRRGIRRVRESGIAIKYSHSWLRSFPLPHFAPRPRPWPAWRRCPTTSSTPTRRGPWRRATRSASCTCRARRSSVRRAPPSTPTRSTPRPPTTSTGCAAAAPLVVEDGAEPVRLPPAHGRARADRRGGLLLGRRVRPRPDQEAREDAARQGRRPHAPHPDAARADRAGVPHLPRLGTRSTPSVARGLDAGRRSSTSPPPTACATRCGGCPSRRPRRSSTAFAAVPALYIADGHHRAASACRTPSGAAAEGPRRSTNASWPSRSPTTRCRSCRTTAWCGTCTGGRPEAFRAARGRALRRQRRRPGRARAQGPGRDVPRRRLVDARLRRRARRRSTPDAALDVSLLQDGLLDAAARHRRRRAPTSASTSSAASAAPASSSGSSTRGAVRRRLLAVPGVASTT